MVASNLAPTGAEPTQELGLPHSSCSHTASTAKGLCTSPFPHPSPHFPHRSFCWEHRPQQALQPRPSQDNTCSICLDTVEDKISYKTMGCPACQDARFHRHCIQRLALHSGIGFRCPCCLNQDPFTMEMLIVGIRLPKRLGFLLPSHKAQAQCQPRDCPSRPVRLLAHAFCPQLHRVAGNGRRAQLGSTLSLLSLADPHHGRVTKRSDPQIRGTAAAMPQRAFVREAGST